MGVINIKIEWWRRGPLKKCSKSAAKSDEKWNRVLEALFQNVFLLLLGLSYSSPFRGARREPHLKIQGLKKGPKWTIFNVFLLFLGRFWPWDRPPVIFDSLPFLTPGSKLSKMVQNDAFWSILTSVWKKRRVIFIILDDILSIWSFWTPDRSEGSFRGLSDPSNRCF